MTRFVQDLRHAWRSLAGRPGIALFAIVTLAVGVGATASIYGQLHTVLLRPAPYPEPDRLVEIQGAFGLSPQRGAVVAPWVRELDAFERTSLYIAGGGANVGDANAVRASVALVSADFFPTLGVLPDLGRGFVEDDELSGDAAVVSDAFWRARLGGSADVVGTSVIINGRATTVVGVMPRGITYPTGTEVWLPGRRTDALGEAFVPVVLARLRADIPLKDAEAALLAARRELELQAGRPENATGPRLEPIGERFRASARRPLVVLMGAAVLVLLIACANVAGLLVARAVVRRRAVAIHAALGAPRWRLARQVLLEGLLVGTAAALLGVVFAEWTRGVLVGLLPAEVAAAADPRMGGPILAAAIIAGLTTAVLASVVPALRAARIHPGLALRGGVTPAHHHHRFRDTLTVVEVALAVVLLAGAGLLVRSVHNLQAVDMGFRPAGVVSADFHLPVASYSPERIGVFARELDRRLHALPAVEAAAIADHLPLGGRLGLGVALEPAGIERDDSRDAYFAALRAVTSDYFTAIGAQLVSGRAFRTEDATGPAVFIVSDVAARELWPGAAAVGQRLVVHMPGGAVEGDVVGVVHGVRASGPDHDAAREVYLPFEQSPTRVLSLVVRSSRDPASVVPTIRSQLAALDPHVPLFNVRTLADAVASATADRRIATILLSLFAGIAVLLAATGLYGVLAYLVTQRTREIGVRMAMGAREAQVMRLVLGQAGKLVGAGAVLGTLTAFIGARLLGALLFEVSPTDPGVLAAAPAALALFALVAAALPTRRAARIDPMEALRHE